MCRWLAYSGSPVLLEDLLLNPDHSLIDQSLHAKLGAVTTNGDGFGIGWFDAEDTPGTYHSVEPAWNDRNLKELARHITSPLVLAHVRASTGGAIQQTNCHPFRYGRWLWMHNGQLSGFNSVKRDLAFAVDPSLYPSIEGSTDSELFFYLALSLGLEDDPPSAVERAVGFIEATGHAQGIEHPIKMSVATTNGDKLWFLRAQYPEHPVLHRLSPETRIVVSEPLSDLVGAWNEVPESTCGVVGHGQYELRPFTPQAA
jgi:glutamine amidotransferase